MRPRVRRLLGWTAAAWLLWALFAALVLPVLAKSLLASQLSQALGGREVMLESVAINPLTLSVEVNGLSVKAPSGAEQFGLAKLHVNFSVSSVAQVGIVVDELQLVAPHLALTRLADGRYDISDLLEQWLSPRENGPSRMPRFSLNNIRISEGRLELDDRPKGVRHEARDIGLSLPFISSMPYKADVFVLPAVSATVDGSRLSLKGKSKPFAENHVSELDVDLRALDLARLQPYLPAGLPLRLAGGQLDTALKIGFSQQRDGTASVSLSGTGQLKAVRLTEPSGAPFLSLDQLTLALQQADPIRGRWSLDQLQLDGLRIGPGPQNRPDTPLQLEQLVLRQATLDLPARRVDAALVQATALQGHVLRMPDGQLQWLTLPHSPPAANAPAQAPAGPTTDWVLRADRLTLASAGLHFEDRSVTPTAMLAIAPLNLTVAPFDSSPGHSNAIQLTASVNPAGKLNASGTLQWQPLAIELALNTQAMPLSPLQGYVAPYLNHAELQGLVSNQGQLSIDQQQGVLHARYRGQLTLGQFRASDLANRTDLLKWKSLYLGGMDLQLEPLQLKFGEVALSNFDARLILNREGRLNLADMLRQTPAAARQTGATNAAKAAAALPLQIAKVTLQNGRVNFSDQFVQPHYSATITRLGGSVLNLSSAAGTLADLDLRGTYAGNAPVHISARLNPLADRKFLDLQADISSIDLVGLSPYAGKYAGYNIDKGKLSLIANYRLDNRQLTADNRLFIDQLTFGEKVDSPDATQLPVHLAIALLRNNRGEIDIHLPISGSLDDPQFSVGGLIFKAMANLFVKAVSAPFTLLGSLFGSGQELSHIGFAPGRARLDEAALLTLKSLAVAMREREGLKLEIRGNADRQRDEEGLRQASLERALRAEKRKDLGNRPAEALTAQDLQITAEEYPTYLTRAYQQARFPKPRNLIGLPKTLPLQEMEKLMLAQQVVSEDDLRGLAGRRAQAAQSWLVEQGGISPARLFLLPAQLGAGPDRAAADGRHQVDFSLR